MVCASCGAENKESAKFCNECGAAMALGCPGCATPYRRGQKFCEECGFAKSLRLFPGMLTGCATCDEVVTRHHCTGRPDVTLGASWTCPGCGTVWTAREEEETCESCGQGIGTMRRAWDTIPGDRLDTAPRYVPQPFTPFRNPFPGARR